MKAAVEKSLKENDINKVWKVRNREDIFSGKTEESKEMLKTKKNVHNNRNQKEVSIHSSPKTPPNRVYTGLDKVENKIRERNPMELPVEKVAKVIDKFRKGIEKENDKELQKSQIELKKR